MSTLVLDVENESGLPSVAGRIAPLLKAGDVICLQGDLGAGKTAFARALVNALADAPEDVPSPTFTLVQTYDLKGFTLWHFDLYRVERQGDILELGWDEARRDGVAVVEWPERLAQGTPQGSPQGTHSLLPANRLEISIAFVKDSENARRLTLTPFGTWQARLQGA